MSGVFELDRPDHSSRVLPVCLSGFIGKTLVGEKLK